MSATNQRQKVVPSRTGCNCGDDAFGDKRVGQCAKCGHQVPGYDVLEREIGFTLGTGDHSTYAKKRRRI
jgi:hypothetical protein